MAATQNRYVVAREAILVNVGGRPPEWRQAVVKNHRTQQLEVVTLTEEDPIDPGDLGMPFAFSKGELVERDHPAVIDCPSGFREPHPGEIPS
jgi:hypothetical protein